MNIEEKKTFNLSINMRLATIDDLDEIMFVEKNCFSESWPQEAILEEIADRSWSRVYIAEHDDKIVGFMIFWIVDYERQLLNFATLPNYRRQSIGTQMLEFLIDEAKKDLAAEIILEVRRSNTAAKNLYKKYHFKPIGIRPGYYTDDNEDAIVMILNL